MALPLTLSRIVARPLALLLALIAVCASPSTAQVKDLKPQGYVDDFAGALSAATKGKLTTLCEEVDHKAGAQIAVVTVKSLGGETIEQFSLELATQWGVGPKQLARGVLILLAPSEHKYRFEVGYGLEPILPDGKVGGFGREAVPLLRANDYDGAVLLMTQRVAEVIAADKGVTLTALGRANQPVSEPDSGTPGLIFGMPIHTFAIVAFFLFTLVFVPLLRFFIYRVFGVWGGPPHRRGGPSWWISGPWGNSWGGGGYGGRGGGGFGGGGGGFGGFGGGSFGGGGASGSW